MYSMLALEYLFNPQTVVTKEEIIALENQILERLINADVYTIFNLKFLALQKCWLAAVSNFVTFSCTTICQ